MSDIKGMFTGAAAWPELNWVVTDALPLPKEGDSWEFDAPEAADVAFLQYTSGKTIPKKERNGHRHSERGSEREGLEGEGGGGREREGRGGGG